MLFGSWVSASSSSSSCMWCAEGAASELWLTLGWSVWDCLVSATDGVVVSSEFLHLSEEDVPILCTSKFSAPQLLPLSASALALLPLLCLSTPSAQPATPGLASSGRLQAVTECSSFASVFVHSLSRLRCLKSKGSASVSECDEGREEWSCSQGAGGGEGSCIEQPADLLVKGPLP